VTSNDPALYDDNETAARMITKADSSQIIPSKVKVWPVPAKGRFNVLLNGIQQPVAVEIYGIDGAMVGKTETVFPGATKSFSIAKPGIYVVKGMNKENGELVFVNKVIIE
jgi:Cu/Ag efflux pump CusA